MVPSLNGVAGGLTSHTFALACIGIPPFPVATPLNTRTLTLASIWVPSLDSYAEEVLWTLTGARGRVPDLTARTGETSTLALTGRSIPKLIAVARNVIQTLTFACIKIPHIIDCTARTGWVETAGA